MLAGDPPRPPLIDAAWRGRAADVAALLAGGADVNEPNLNGVTPLYIACQEGHAEVVMKLLAANADVGRRLRGARDPARRRVGGVALSGARV